jgi:hypothetical protein
MFWFSPNGRLITFIDRGPGPDGKDAPQVFILDILDITTGNRTQVTHLPDAAPDPLDPATPATDFCAFQDDATIVYSSRVNPNGLNPEGQRRIFTVKTDGSGLTEVPLPAITATGGMIVPHFSITSPATFFDVEAVSLPRPPVNPSPYWNMISEVFVTGPDHELQLTSFGRGDTGAGDVDTDGERVFFVASANQFNNNPSENCQIFSISVLADDLTAAHTLPRRRPLRDRMRRGQQAGRLAAGWLRHLLQRAQI